MKKITYAVLLISLSLICAKNAWALGRFALGPEVGFTYQMNRDPTGSKLAGAPGYEFGLSGVYEFDRDMAGVAIDYYFGVSGTGKMTYRNVTVGGVTGTYRESVTVFNWLFGGRYYFGKSKWRPYGGLAVGFQYFRRRGVDYRDQFNVELPDPPSSSHINFVLCPQGGIEYRPTFRWAIGLNLRVPVAIRSSGMVPGVQVPVTVHIAF
jgi:hypothetical protein